MPTLSIRDNSWYGWKPDLPDIRDFQFSAAEYTLKNLPSKVDLRKVIKLPIFNQGKCGSCTGNSAASAHMYCQMQQRTSYQFIPSRLFIYYNERLINKTTSIDCGAHLRDAVKVLNKAGVCPETSWPYDISKFAVKPDHDCYHEARKYQATKYERILQNLDSLKGCIAEGFPFIFGFSVYNSFEGKEVAKSGILNMPTSDERMCGGHAVIAIGYNDTTSRFTIQNSWGSDWGQEGYFTMPYDYMINPRLAADFWTIKLLE